MYKEYSSLAIIIAFLRTRTERGSYINIFRATLTLWTSYSVPVLASTV